MRVLVCGGRDYSDRDHFFSEMDRLNQQYGPFTVVIHGAASGADKLAGLWGEQRSKMVVPYPAKWDDLSQPDAVIKYTKTGKPYDARAGFRRNTRMLIEGKPDLVIAYPGGQGTMDMVNQSNKAGVRVVLVK